MFRPVTSFTLSRSLSASFVRTKLTPPSPAFSSLSHSPVATSGKGLPRKGQSFFHSNKMTTRKVLVPIAEDSEELEAVAIIDTLRRAGCEVTVASVGSSPEVRMSRNVRIVADCLISAVEKVDFDMIAIPGGMPGAAHCRDSTVLAKLLQKQKTEKKWIAAICASPVVVLHSHGLLEKEKAVCYPSFTEKLPSANRGEGRVCVSNHFVTSVGPGTALEFALKLVELLVGKEASNKIGAGMAAST